MIVEVRGVPAPQGSKRHIGNGRMIEMSKAVGPWREAVRGNTERAMNGIPELDGPVMVGITFRLARPKGHYRTGRNAHLLRDSAPAAPATRPDLDKLVRATLDGLTMGGAWSDDCQIVQLAASKIYGPPGCTITFYRAPELEGT